jgi:hypothetical protein
MNPRRQGWVKLALTVPALAIESYPLLMWPVFSPVLFGLVIWLWHAQAPNTLLRLRTLVFLALTVPSLWLCLIAPFRLFLNHGGIIDMPSEASFAAGVLLGTVALSCAQKLTLGTTWLRVATALVLAPAAWWIMVQATSKSRNLWLEILAWQVTYLLCMFLYRQGSENHA